MRTVRRWISLVLALSLATAQAAASSCPMPADERADAAVELAAHDHHGSAEPSGSAGREHGGAIECAVLMCSAAAPAMMLDPSTVDRFAFDPAGTVPAPRYTSAVLTCEPPPPRPFLI